MLRGLEFMKKADFFELINIDSLKKMTENLYAATGIPIGILGTDGTVYLSVGWQDLCVKYHRKNPAAYERCKLSDTYINEHINEYYKTGKGIAYKCLNNMWDIGIPFVISNQHIATIYFGQFFYDDEKIDEEYYRAQAVEFGFDQDEYLAEVRKIPIFSREKVEYITQYYVGFVQTLAESGLRYLENKIFQKGFKNRGQYFNKIFNSVNDGIIIHDIDGRIIDINKTGMDMFGYTYNEATNLNISKLISENSLLTSDEIVNQLSKLNTEQHRMIELIAKNKSNQDFWIEVNMHVIKIGDKNRVIAAVRDIDYRKKTELELQNKAIEMEKIRTEFFSNISHELKTPLNVLLGSIQIMNMMTQNKEIPIDRDKIDNHLKIQKQNCLRLLKLINNLIDSNKLELGDYSVNMVNYNIVSLVEEVTMSVVEYVKNHGINLIFDTDVEEKIIACDLDKIERIMLNLLSNAVKFTNPDGSIFVKVFDGEEYVTVIVEDTGIGIPEDKQDIIFDRFRQVDKSFTRNREGSGIGLSIVKSLVELQGGTIAVESTYGVGSKFIIKLPARLVEDDKNKEIGKLYDVMAESFEERVRFEFSDIYD